jgi:hypothetical protein
MTGISTLVFMRFFSLGMLHAMQNSSNVLIKIPTEDQNLAIGNYTFCQV